mgnify:CR=1 FL=1
MNIVEIRDFCIAKPAVEETFPFDSDTLVFKVAGKAFLLTSLQNPNSINLKCLPERAIELREQHPAIIPGYHMNKQHGNTVLIDGSLTDSFIFSMINDSYHLVVAGLTKKVRKDFGL